VGQALQLEIQYASAPPFDAGTPEHAPPAVLAVVQARSEQALAERRVQVEKAAAQLGGKVTGPNAPTAGLD
jgi:cyclohexyl-isocyanide hydratase